MHRLLPLLLIFLLAPPSAMAQGSSQAKLLFSLVVEPDAPISEPLHAAGLILRDVDTGAFTPRASVTGIAVTRLPRDSRMVAPLTDLAPHQIGALFLLEVPPGRYRPRQFDVQIELGRGASGPICCPIPVEARAGEITYLGRIALIARRPGKSAPVRAVTLTITDAGDQDIALFETVAPAAAPVTHAVAPHPPVTRYIGDGRFRD